jgi:hypothetical protein
MTDPVLYERTRGECTCPHGPTSGTTLYDVRLPGDPNGRLSTAKGCPEHNACHHWTKANRAKYVIGRPWSIGPWCPIHEGRDCP